jgi:hypothetical protein
MSSLAIYVNVSVHVEIQENVLGDRPAPPQRVNDRSGPGPVQQVVIPKHALKFVLPASQSTDLRSQSIPTRINGMPIGIRSIGGPPSNHIRCSMNWL